MRASIMHLLRAIKEIWMHRASESHLTSPQSYQLMRKLYVVSHGRSNRILWRLLRRKPGTSFAPLTASNATVVKELGERGWSVIPSFLDSHECQELRLLIERCSVANRSQLRIDYRAADLVELPEVIRIACNPTLLGIAATYLRSEPILATVASWTSLHSPQALQSERDSAAQEFHFDLDWPKFVKFFLYLTDVNDLNGPFAIIEGTHKKKPMWSDRRFSEEEIYGSFGLRGLERRIIGKSGTLIVADTSALHRGSPVEAGSRTVLQIEYAVSRFGASQQYGLFRKELRPPSPYPKAFSIFAR